jgi:hypothetical protein
MLKTAMRWFSLGDVAVPGTLRRTPPREQTTWTEQSFLPPRFLWIALALVAAALWPMRAQLANLRSVPDLEDPLFSAWRVGWFAHAIVSDPIHLFDANIFYPAPLTLTYSDAHLLPSALGAPLIWLGADPLVVSNLLLVIAFPLGALAYCIAAWRLAGDVRAATVAGLLAAWHPFRFEHISHLELQWFFWIPLTIVALHAALARGGWAAGAALGAAICAQALSSMYFGLMLAVYLVPFTLCLTAGWRVRASMRLLRAAAAACVVALIAAAIVGPPYLASREARGDRNDTTIREFSATPRDYITSHPHNATWGPRIGRHPKPERGLFPGIMTPALAITGMLPPLPASGIALVVSGALAFDWSLGLNGLTYDELRRLFGPFRGVRAPARFVVFVATSMILLAAFGVRRLLSYAPSGRPRDAVLGLIVVLAWVDLRPRFTLVEAWREPPPIYSAINPSMVLAEFPMRYGWNIAYMYFSTKHWAKLVNGYSGFLPDRFANLQNALATFPTPETLALLRQQGATHVTVNCRFWGGDGVCAGVLSALDAHRDLRLVTRARWERSEVRLYELNPR